MEQITNEQKDKLQKFTEFIYTENQKFNLTGFKTIEDIYNMLIEKSIMDLSEIDVPRGTSAVDLGTGSGVPGVVLAVLNPDKEFTLLDSNNKKIQFIDSVCRDLDIQNVSPVCCRIEEFARENRNRFDLIVSRAFGPLYYSFEFGLSLLAEKGKLFIYSHYIYSNLSEALKSHVKNLGGDGIESKRNDGILVEKKELTPDVYPRRFPVIKREAKKIPEISE